MASSDNATYMVTFVVHTYRAKSSLHSHITCRPGSCIPIFCTENTEEYSSYVHDLHATACRLTCLNIMVMGSNRGGSSNITAAGHMDLQNQSVEVVYFTNYHQHTHTSCPLHHTHIPLTCKPTQPQHAILHTQNAESNVCCIHMPHVHYTTHTQSHHSNMHTTSTHTLHTHTSHTHTLHTPHIHHIHTHYTHTLYTHILLITCNNIFMKLLQKLFTDFKLKTISSVHKH